jgi:cell shape-determining protein MreC
MIDPKEVEDQFQKVLRKCASLREENERLKKLLGLYPEDSTSIAKPILFRRHKPPSLPVVLCGRSTQYYSCVFEGRPV